MILKGFVVAPKRARNESSAILAVVKRNRGFMSHGEKNKPEEWKQDNPRDQLVACLSAITGMAGVIEDHSSDPATISRGKYIREQSEKLLKLLPWVEDKW